MLSLSSGSVTFDFELKAIMTAIRNMDAMPDASAPDPPESDSDPEEDDTVDDVDESVSEHGGHHRGSESEF